MEKYVNNGIMCCILCVILMERWLKDLMCFVVSLLESAEGKVV
jgi:hypothetical protein